MSKLIRLEYVADGPPQSQDDLTLNLMALALRNMADALECQANDPERRGELLCSLCADMGRAWIDDFSGFGVYEAWVHFSAGPGSVATMPMHPTRLAQIESLQEVS